MDAIFVGKKNRCKDGIKVTLIELKKYGKEHHVVVKSNNGEERDLKLSDYCRNWIHLFP